MVRMILWWENVKRGLCSQKGQGTVEYVVLLAVVCGLALLLSDQLTTAITGAVTAVKAAIDAAITATQS